jgi:hypothetical protein
MALGIEIGQPLEISVGSHLRGMLAMIVAVTARSVDCLREWWMSGRGV